MENHIVLSGLGKSKNLINSFLLRNGILLLVEPEQIRRTVYSGKMTYEHMETIRTTGYNVAASVYWEPLTGAEYLLILKDCGVLVLLNSQCERIDILETGIEQDDERKFFVFNERDNQIFINLRTNAIFAISYRLKKNREMRFIKSEEDIHCIFKDVDKIIGMEISWNIDYLTGRDFPTISVLLYHDISQEHHFQVIRPMAEQINRNKRQTWKVFMDYSKLEIGVENKQAILRAVSNIGFFIFGEFQVLFIKLPGGYEQIIKDLEFQTFENFQGCYITYELAHDNRLNLNSGVILRKNTNSLEFMAFSSKNQIIRIRLKPTVEDSDELIYYWDNPSFEVIRIKGKDIALDQQSFSRTIRLSNRVVILLCEFISEIIFLDLDQAQIITTFFYDLSRTFASGVVGTDFHKMVNCGRSSENRGFIESKFLGYSDFFTLIESFNSESEVLRLWNNNKGVWWKDLKGQIFCNGKLIDTCTQSLHIKLDGTIIKDSSVFCWSDIANDVDGNYVYVSSEGYICWSNETKVFLLDKVKSPSVAKYVLTCFKSERNNSKITVLSVDNELIVLQNTHVLKKNFDLSMELDTITCICIAEWNGSLRLLITDIDGKFVELDIKDFGICSRYKIGPQRADICAIGTKGRFLVYTKDDLLLLHSTGTGRFEFTRIEMKDRIDNISAKDDSFIAVLVEGFQIQLYRLPEKRSLPNVINKRIDSHSHVHTKFISLSCSTRYIVTSSLHSVYNGILQRIEYYSEIQLHDLERQKTVFRYDLSERYPQALISDVVGVPFNKRSFIHDSMSLNYLYAMQLAFDKVFMVSLNYEMAEDESLDNLLLFSMDCNKGTLEFLQSIQTGYSVTALLNYRDRIVFVAGEVLQAYRIDYLLKENTFKIEPASNGLTCGGLVKTLIKLPNIVSGKDALTENRKKKLPKTLHVMDRLLVLNILKGLNEYALIHNLDNTPEILRIKIRSVAKSEKSSFLGRPNMSGLITHLAMSQIDETIWLLTSSTDRSIHLYCIPCDEEPSLVQLKLPGNTVSINPIMKEWEPSSLATKQSLIEYEGRLLLMSFAINTAKGEYLLGILQESELFEESKMTSDKRIEEQFKFIGLEEDKRSNLIFVDTRISKDHRLQKFLEGAVL